MKYSYLIELYCFLELITPLKRLFEQKYYHLIFSTER